MCIESDMHLQHTRYMKFCMRSRYSNVNWIATDNSTKKKNSTIHRFDCKWENVVQIILWNQFSWRMLPFFTPWCSISIWLFNEFIKVLCVANVLWPAPSTFSSVNIQSMRVCDCIATIFFEKNVEKWSTALYAW